MHLRKLKFHGASVSQFREKKIPAKISTYTVVLALQRSVAHCQQSQVSVHADIHAVLQSW